MQILSKLLTHGVRLLGARRFGIPYRRASQLAIPRQIRLQGTMIPLHLPKDIGIRSDLLACLMEDVYGLRKLSSPPSTILDIGANVGLFSLAARSYFPDATIHAYEPNPRTLPYLEHQARQAHFTMFREAVGNRGGSVTITELGDTNLARTNSEVTAGVAVPMVSLSTVVERLGPRVELAKIDCEGAEWELFEDRDAWRRIQRIRMEYHLFKGETFPQLVATLHGLGYTITKHVPSGDFGLVWCENCVASQ